MPSSAVTPPNEAPYPTDVGTARDVYAYKSTHYRRESPFHSCADYHRICLQQFGADGQQAVHTRDADIVEAGDACAEGFGSYRSLFRYWQIAGARTHDGNVAAKLCGGAVGDGSRSGVVDGVRMRRDEGRGGCRIDAGGQDIHTIVPQAGEDAEGLCGGLPCCVNHFRQAGAQTAVMVDAGMAEVFERQRRQAVGSVGWRELAAFNFRQNLEECGGGHRGFSRYAARAACCTCLSATPCCCAMVLQSSNSGAAFISFPAREPTFIRISPYSVETVMCLRSKTQAAILADADAERGGFAE